MGLGRKVFTRERATVADVQGYLMDQTVMDFASASARSTAIAAPSDDMVSLLRNGPPIPDVARGGAWRPITEVDGFARATSSFSSGATETRVVGSLNWTGQLYVGRKYELLAHGLFGSDTDGAIPELRLRGARGTTPSSASLVLAMSAGYLVSAARSQTWVALGRFGVAVSGSHTISPFFRRLGGAGTVSVGPDDSGSLDLTVRDVGAYVSGMATIP